MNKRDFLSTLYRDSQGFLELRALGGHGAPWQEFAALHAHNQVESFCATATLQKRNVFFGVCLRDGAGGRKENLTFVPCIWTDIDFKQTSRERALKSLKELPFKASIIVLSGGGAHVYFVLKEPVSLVDDPTTIEKIENINKRLALHVGGDPASTDIARILRLPDSINFKYDPPRPVRVIHLEKFQYELDDFDFLPELPEPKQETKHGNGEWITNALRGVESGSRNATGAKLAGYFLAQGIHLDIILELLALWNSRNRPPLDGKEIEQVVRSILRYEGNHAELYGPRQCRAID